MALAARLQMPCFVSINFLPNAVYQAATCIRATLEAARRHGFPTSRLIFEVTETSAIGNITRAQEFAARLSEFGCGFALDDFGTGFASFYYLKHIGSDYVKIDGSFIKNLHNDPDSQVLGRPRPEPPNLRVVELSACENG